MQDCFHCEELNGNLMSNRWIFQATVALCFLILKVMCSGVFEVSVGKLNNNRGVTHNGKCCKGPSTYPPCSGECDTFITVCLMHYVQSMPSPNRCTYGHAVSLLYGKNNIAHKDQSTDGIMQLPIDFAWPEKFTIIVEAWHAVNGELTVTDSTQLIIQSFISTTLKPSLEWSSDTTITPTSEQQVRFRLLCNKHYYGTGCDVLCRPRDDPFGHFTCSEKGTKICRHGWDGEYCDKPSCSQECLENKGTCDRPFECRCRLGWQGKNCEECRPYTGCLHGYCHQPYQCICENGWAGTLCDIDTRYCMKIEPCLNGGTCVADLVGNYTCQCPPGYGGRNCQNTLCFEGFCKNGGVCQSRAGLRECMCPEKFVGDQCQFKILSCKDIDCQNDGSCISGPLGGSCVCLEGYKGERCEHKILPCSSNPCKNGAECRDHPETAARFRCICPVGFGGFDCAITIHPCATIKCLNGGTCKGSSDSKRPVCACADGYSGEFCAVLSDPCKGVTCLNSGKCKLSTMGNGFICHCADGYYGEMCESETNPCESSPCKNGGFCKNYISYFLCICPEHFTGQFCETNEMNNVRIVPSTQNDDNREDEHDVVKASDETVNTAASSSGLSTNQYGPISWIVILLVVLCSFS